MNANTKDDIIKEAAAKIDAILAALPYDEDRADALCELRHCVHCGRDTLGGTCHCTNDE